MDTAYKTRAWWAMRALSYSRAIVEHKPRNIALCVPMESQEEIWDGQMREAMAAAMGPSGSEALTRKYVDRQGNLLPEYVAE